MVVNVHCQSTWRLEHFVHTEEENMRNAQNCRIRNRIVLFWLYQMQQPTHRVGVVSSGTMCETVITSAIGLQW